ncbi:scavenger receptor cysteine-rich type 1 protein M130-like [Girardinichthys multiradiatus]|uniref:scavenger receptor cysteine-rich type 1 protein M130-like n=1 Tax=Girardinichthys multiradiatus TaxID=208333 RepID=UPI001FABE71D|nr:scavenger receptor cysteine-rich type 1 protein M130-like [Girardinichthys multiradiatus]
MDGKVLMLLLLLCNSVLPDKFRLVEGPSHCAGTLQLRDQENWKQVQDMEFVWNWTMAAEVCRQLDCGSLVAITRNNYKDWSDFNMEITCSDTVRLGNGISLCSGILEVKSDQLNQSWISVNMDGFGQRDADMVCKELGCGPVSVLLGKPYVKAHALALSVKCTGIKAALSECFSSVGNYSGKAVGLTCLEPKGIRLVGGDSRCVGTLQMKHRGEWKPVYKKAWTLRFAGEVCKQLDCGSPLSITRETVRSRRVFWDLHDCNGPSMTDCVKGIVYSEHFTKITCSGSVRLVHGSNHCSGRLEVKLNELWSSVCDEGFNQQDAEVVCREIGCGPASVIKRIHYGKVDAPIWKKEVHCSGNESSLLNCERSWLRKSTCPSDSKAVELTCSDPEVRLVGGTGRCAGYIEIKKFGQWRAADDKDEICDWTLKQADVICQRLDCGMSVSRRLSLHSPKQSFFQIDFSCTQTLECMKLESFYSIFRVEITCSDSIRLVNSSNQCSGRLELKMNQLWSTVCEKDFDKQDAEVVCREIGCGPPVILQGALFGGEEAPLKRRAFQCEGNESSLLDCRGSGSATTCSPENVVGLTCSDYIRLAGETSRCAGTLEMLYQGQWKPVVDKFDLLGEKLTHSVCAELGCGAFVSARTEEKQMRSVWWITSICVESGNKLRECGTLNDDIHDTSIEVICSDLLVEPHISLFFYSEEVRAPTNQTLGIPIGSAFAIMCSIKPQYQAGSFELVLSSSTSRESFTLPAVNHSTLFLFSAANHKHQGTYSCIYHAYVFSHNFSSVSQPICLTISAEFIIRPFVVLMVMMASILILYCYFKVCSCQMSEQEKNRYLEDCSTKSYLKEETAVSSNK